MVPLRSGVPILSLSFSLSHGSLCPLSARVLTLLLQSQSFVHRQPRQRKIEERRQALEENQNPWLRLFYRQPSSIRFWRTRYQAGASLRFVRCGAGMRHRVGVRSEVQRCVFSLREVGNPRFGACCMWTRFPVRSGFGNHRDCFSRRRLCCLVFSVTEGWGCGCPCDWVGFHAARTIALGSEGLLQGEEAREVVGVSRVRG